MNIINTSLFKWYRKRYLEIIYQNILNTNNFCCNVKCFYGFFINFKDLKEVKENNNSIYLNGYISELDFPKTLSWFKDKNDRLNFLKECLNKF